MHTLQVTIENLREKKSCESVQVATGGASSSLQGRGDAEAAEPGELVSSRAPYPCRYSGGVLLSSRTFYVTQNIAVKQALKTWPLHLSYSLYSRLSPMTGYTLKKEQV